MQPGDRVGAVLGEDDRLASLYARRNDPLDLAAKIVELLDDPQRRQAMGSLGRRRVLDELEWRHEAPKLLAAYDALWTSSAPRARPAV